MLGLAAGVAAFKGWSRGDDVSSWSTEKWLTEAIDRSGIAGAMRVPMNVARQALASKGILDVAPSRFIDREVEGMAVAPTVSMAGRVVRGIVAADRGDYWEATKGISKVIPMNNLWGVKNTLIKLGEEH